MNNKILSKYPKTRIELPDEIQKIYASHYKVNRDGKSTTTFLSSKMESWLHKMVARDVSNNSSGEITTLEIGAGTLNQLAFEENNGIYDIVEPWTDLYKDSKYISQIDNIYKDTLEVPAENQYDRITSVATLEHICNLPQVIAKSCLLLKVNGNFLAAIPNEGTILWYLGWRLFTGLEYYIKYKQDYGILMKYEHVNTANDIELVLKCFFSSVKCKVFGLNRKLGLYRFFECSSPKIDFANQYLKTN